MAHRSEFTRRNFLRTSLGAVVALILAACGKEKTDSGSASDTAVPTQPSTALPTAEVVPSSSLQAQVLPPTPACGDDDDDPTPAQTEGPYYTPNTPLRTSFLEAGIVGTTLVVSGLVLATDCTPIADALIDFWHCDDAGVYDNEGYKLRGHQFTDANGQYQLETIVPALYPGRTRHIHVKVQAPNQPILTTQLYFPNEAQNSSDGIFNAALVMDVQDTANGKTAAFDFVLDVA